MTQQNSQIYYKCNILFQIGHFEDRQDFIHINQKKVIQQMLLIKFILQISNISCFQLIIILQCSYLLRYLRIVNCITQQHPYYLNFEANSMISHQLPSKIRDTIAECNKICKDWNSGLLKHLAILDQIYNSVLNQKPVQVYVCQCGQTFQSRGQKGPHCKACPAAKSKRGQKKIIQESQKEVFYESDESKNEESMKRERSYARLNSKGQQNKDKKQNPSDCWKSTFLRQISPKKIKQELYEEEQAYDSYPSKMIKKE